MAASPVTGAPLLEVDTRSHQTLVVGAPHTLAAKTWRSTSHWERSPEATALDLVLVAADGKKWALGAHLLPTGEGDVTFAVPDAATGAGTLIVSARGGELASVKELPVLVESRRFLSLRTDRPQARAGEDIRWRAALLDGVSGRPLVGAAAQLLVKDDTGQAIWQGTVKAGPGGFSVGEVPVDESARPGTWTLAVSHAEHSTSASVEVRRVRLPAFFTEAKLERTDRGVQAQVSARTPWAAPVEGVVAFELQSAGERVSRQVALDSRGMALAHFDLDGQQAASLTAKVTDVANRSERASASVEGQLDSVVVRVVPGQKPLACGVPQRVAVVMFDAEGELSPGVASLQVGQVAVATASESPGASWHTVVIPCVSSAGSLNVDAVAEVVVDGHTHRASLAIEVASGATGSAHVSVTPTLLERGRPAQVQVYWPEGGENVDLVLVRAGAAVVSAKALPQPGAGPGWYSAALDIPSGVVGAVTIQALSPSQPRPGQAVARVLATSAWVRPDRLALKLAAPAESSPGARVPLTMSVLGADGKPADGAVAAVSVVDSRALALGPRALPLLDALSREDFTAVAQAAGLVAEWAARADLGQAEQVAVEALAALLPADARPPALGVTAWELLASEQLAVQSTYCSSLIAGFLARGGAVVAAGGPEGFSAPVADVLVQGGLSVPNTTTPWQERWSHAYATRLGAGCTPARLAIQVTEERFNLACAKLEKHLSAARAAARRGSRSDDPAVRRYLNEAWLQDGWGRAWKLERGAGSVALTLVSAGEDGVFDNSDDLSAEIYLPGQGLWGMGSGYGGGSLGSRAYGSVKMAGTSTSRVAPDASVRSNFAETALWSAGLEADPTGAIELEVPLSDSITTWSIEVDAIDPRGALGHASASVVSKRPAFVDVRAPAELAVGDAFDVPVAVVASAVPLEGGTLRLAADGAISLLGEASAPLALGLGQTLGTIAPVKATAAGVGTLRVELFDASGVRVDGSEHRVSVEGVGALQTRAVRARAEAGRAHLQVPPGADPLVASIKLKVLGQPSDFALDGLESLIREPHGCFEQTSSTLYPSLLVLDLLAAKAPESPAVARARKMVAQGYQRLLTFEVPGGGFSWFGESPANQVLTAYGLLEFADMARVAPVDPTLVRRTAEWLAQQQKPDGRFEPDASWLHDWSAVQGRVSTTAYVAWALAGSGQERTSLSKALGFLRKNRREVLADPYLAALWAGAEAHGGDPARASEILAALREVSAQGLFRAPKRTLLYGEGAQARVEVTALAADALSGLSNAAAAHDPLQWLVDNRSPRGGWGPTQPTVLALRALTAASRNARPIQGAVKVANGDQSLGSLPLESNGEVPVLALSGAMLNATASIQLEGPDAPWLAELTAVWRETELPTARSAGLEVVMSAPTDAVEVGGAATVSVTVRNAGEDPVAMPTIVLPVPPGFRAAANTFAAIRRAGAAKAEDRGAELHIYLTQLAAGQLQRFVVELEAEAAVDVLLRPARAYAYYAPEREGTSAPARLRAVSRR
jgi:hypothetical protein